LNSHPAGLDSWILTGPRWHPVWYQYNLGIVSLADTPGLPPAKLHRPGVTHELTVVALNPDHGPYDARRLPDGHLQFLTPVNIVEQFTATDQEARELAFQCARAVVDGLLWPETGDAPDTVRAAWRSSVHQTLAHAHDPHHGRLN
ncbi:hypothetical protein PYK79_57100, partial [Streptomyces sp. ID05-04B]|uniref:hypothetical protein n=1 Tax=Streptomyces sp. ID05-04B TaxID=3028661 RepID=UPI0029C4952D